jgi:hypothetical protein
MLRLQALVALRARLATSQQQQPPDDELLKWYLRDRYFDVDEAEQKLRTLLRWQRDFRCAPCGGPRCVLSPQPARI